MAVEMTENLLHLWGKDMHVPSTAILSHGADLHGPAQKSAFCLVTFDKDESILLVFENDGVSNVEILGETLTPMRDAELLR